jgi:hypothetical protein
MKRINCVLMMVLFTVSGCTNPDSNEEDTDTGTDTGADTDTDSDSDTDTDTDSDTDTDGDTDTDSDTDTDTDSDSDTDTDVDPGTDCSYLTDVELNIVGNWYHCGHAGDDAHLLGIQVVVQLDGCYLSFSGPAAEDDGNSVHISGQQKEESGAWPLSFHVMSTYYTIEGGIGFISLVTPLTCVCLERYNPADAGVDAGG